MDPTRGFDDAFVRRPMATRREWCGWADVVLTIVAVAVGLACGTLIGYVGTLVMGGG